MSESKVDNIIEGVLPGDAVLLENLLTVQNVSKSFAGSNGKPTTVLADVNLTIRDILHKPQIVSILGPSGSGKTTLLRLIAGLDKPDAGAIFCHTDREGMRAVRVGDVGVVFQRYPLFDDRTVLLNLIEPAKNSGLSNVEAGEKSLQYLADFGLSQHANSYPMQLSGGQRQRVAIAQQLIQNRYYVILDEPFSGLDPNNLHNVIKLLTNVANQHTINTFIIVTHDVTSALIISDHVYLLGETEPGRGARVVKEYDLLKEGLAYRADIEDLPRFLEIRKEIKYVEFPKLVIKKS